MRLLCVDDDGAFLMLYREFFSAQCGIEVTTALGYGQAVSCLQQQTFDAVITDLCLGHDLPDGRDLVTWLVEHERSEFIIVVAGRSTVRDEWPEGAKMVRIVMKPFSLLELWSTLKDLVPNPSLS